ncbi:hypothetical protein HDU92_006310 [Lobulomyces angularis]|nr:hypothetical protein HDU92_006310 [Lobulomyces angularis]
MSNIEKILAFNSLVQSNYRNSTPLFILHGLFGSKQNFGAISKQIHQRLKSNIYTLDLRNHGDSFHSNTFNYQVMVNDVLNVAKSIGLNKINVLGHSMGAKVAMNLALNSSSVVNQLLIVDMAPVDMRMSKAMQNYIDLMIQIDKKGVQSANEADKILATEIPEKEIRSFLLTNLKQNNKGLYKFRINLDSLKRNYQNLGKFEVDENCKFFGKSLFIAGSKSDYVVKEREDSIQKYFPNSTIEYLDTGHWVHSERPKEFLSLVENFLADKGQGV